MSMHEATVGVSVVVPCYKARHHIEACARSILG
jgi:hypothetical protein